VRTALIWLAAALSGAAGLSYEVLWSRALVVPLGNSADAAAVVLAGFMLGLGAGAHAGASPALRRTSPLRAYAALELGAAAWALVAPRALAALARIPARPLGPEWPALGLYARHAAALALIVVPCLAMGAALPLLVRALTAGGASLRTRVGVAYGLNTAGAAAGSVATGFFGVAALGVRACSTAAAAAGVAASLTALLASPPEPEPLPEPEPDPGGARARYLALGAAAATGFVMLALELLWSRMLTFVFGHDTYAFATLLATVLVGLALGGLAHRALCRLDQGAVVATLLALLGATSLGGFWVAAALVARSGRDPFALDASQGLDAGLWLELWREVAYTPILVLATCAVAGALFPAACSLYGAASEDAGRAVGRIGLANGLGSALGVASFALGVAGALGIQRSFVALALLSAAASAVVLAAASFPRPRVARALGAAAIAATLLCALLLPVGLPRRMLLAVVGPRHQRLLHYEEARTGTISVIENQINGERQLLVDAVNEVTTRLVHDQSFKLLGHLGPLLHPRPRTGVMVCLGAGISAGAALAHPLERLDVVDLSAAVARGARLFAAENRGALDDPRMRLHAGDGRRFLLDSPGGYDVAIVDSTHPKAVDSWILYTREMYELVRDRLAPRGIAVQWLPLHGLSERELKIVVRTFQSAFPDMTLWANAGVETYGQVAYAKLVGARSGVLAVDRAQLARRLAEPPVRDDLAPYGMAGADEILDLFVAGPEALRAWTEGLPVQTDDQPLVPYATGWSAGRRMEPSLLLGVRSPSVPAVSGNSTAGDPGGTASLAAAREAQGLVLAGMLESAARAHPDGAKTRLYAAQAATSLGYYERLAALYHDDPERLFEAGTQLGGLGHAEQARRAFERAIALRPGDVRVRLNLALVALGLGHTDRAIELLARLRAEHPRSAVVLRNLGSAVLAAGDAQTAAAHLRQALAWDPDALGARLELARAYLGQGRPDRAVPELELLVRANPWIAEAHELLGVAAARSGEHARAAGHLERAVTLFPYRTGSLRELASASRAIGAHDRAADAALRWLELDPGDARAATDLGAALRGQGRSSDAVQAQCLALRLRPGFAPALRELGELGASESACER
jgi:spermidine synthase